MTAEVCLKWSPVAWRADVQLRLCSLPARGLWIDLLGYMHEAVPYGFLLINGASPTCEELAVLLGVRKMQAIREALNELERREVFSRDEAKRIYSRRMVRDEEKRLRDKAYGKGGGNPLLKPQDNGGVNPTLNAEDKARTGTGAGPDAPEREQGSARVPGKNRSSKATSKTKSKALREPATPFAPPSWVPSEEWIAFDAMRKAKNGKAWTDDGRRYAINTLERLRDIGQLQAAVLRQSVERSWSGLFAVKVGGIGSGTAEPTLAEKRAQNIAALTGKVRDDRAIEGTAKRVGDASVLPPPGDLREPNGNDVGRR